VGVGVGVGVALCRDFGSRSELPASWMQDPDQWREMDPSLEEVRLLSCMGLLTASYTLWLDLPWLAWFSLLL
jgi:hypothetical protein